MSTMTIRQSPWANTSSTQGTTGVGKPKGPPPGGKGGPPSHETVIEDAGLSDEVAEETLATVAEMQEAGASFEEIKAFVDETLEANGIERPSKGTLLDVQA